MDKRGRKPNLQRRKLAADLRARGLTLPETGKRLGITKQAAAYLLQPLGSGRPLHFGFTRSAW